MENPSYEQARDALVETAKLLELGQMNLDESLALWERGEALARRCEEYLADVRVEVEATLASKNQDVSASAENVSDEDQKETRNNRWFISFLVSLLIVEFSYLTALVGITTPGECSTRPTLLALTISRA